MRILVLGVSGMLGSTLYKYLSLNSSHDVVGTIRSPDNITKFPRGLRAGLVSGVDVLSTDSLEALLVQTRPDVVINCVGLIKQHKTVDDPLQVLPVNSLLPHRLAAITALAKARLIHISTDCVFSGKMGSYTETDVSDASDLYGKSKYIGEVYDKGHVLTIRTSIIGHELCSNHSLLDWFLSQRATVKGYRRAIFSGLPTFELARVICDFILPHANLHGLYHVAAEPINKYDLLNLIAEVYSKKIDIIPDDEVQIDRSLRAEKIFHAVGYRAPLWPDLISEMHKQQ
jgi:dTDP-4-dehydrorhamnose reductase